MFRRLRAALVTAALILAALPLFAPAASAAATSGFPHIAPGAGHTCGLTANGTAYCWGYDADGRLGNGPITGNQPSPSRVATTLKFTQLAGGDFHMCGLEADGSAHCWGSDMSGQLGNGALNDRNAPSPVATTLKFKQLTGGGGHTCGLTLDGTAYCWGNDYEGRLGNGTALTENQETPSPVDTALKFSELSASYLHTCGLAVDGTAHCWGNDGNGRLGDGSVLASKASPSPVQPALTFTQVVGGSSHTCGLEPDGTAHCWGYDWNGQLGNGTTLTADQPSPSPVQTTVKFSRLGAGNFHTCGLALDATAHCWGQDYDGQQGNGTTISADQPAPQHPVAGGLLFDRLDSGNNHVCAWTTAGVAHCWGNDGNGQLGNGAALTGPQKSPTAVDISGVRDSDGDGLLDVDDGDDDNDGVADSQDAFPLNAGESVDTDGDGTGNNADGDDDGDGVADGEDAFPLHAGEWVDTDGDDTGDNADGDDDGDGVADGEDAFPLHAGEWVDTDGDETGDNADTDDDGDGVSDGEDAFPLQAGEWVDTDGDGTGNNADTDDDNDGIADDLDAFPTDADARIAYVKHTADGSNPDIWSMTAGGGDQVRLTTTGDARGPAPSPDGSRIAFTRGRNSRAELWVMNADGTNKVRLTQNTVLDTTPAWSPDGSRLAFTSARSGAWQLHVMNVATSRVRKITAGRQRPATPTWSPDGVRLAFVGYAAGASRTDLFTISSDGTGLRRLTTTTAADESHPSYAPTGGRIAYAAGGTTCSTAVFTLPTAGGSRTLLMDTGCADTMPAWSPNGNRIALHSNGPDPAGVGRASGIWTVSPDGTRRHNVTVDEGTDPAWQPLPTP